MLVFLLLSQEIPTNLADATCVAQITTIEVSLSVESSRKIEQIYSAFFSPQMVSIVCISLGLSTYSSAFDREIPISTFIGTNGHFYSSPSLSTVN